MDQRMAASMACSAVVLMFLLVSPVFSYIPAISFTRDELLDIWQYTSPDISRFSRPLTEKQAHNIKDPAVYLTVGMGYFFLFLSLFVINPSGGFAAKKLFF